MRAARNHCMVRWYVAYASVNMAVCACVRACVGAPLFACMSPGWMRAIKSRTMCACQARGRECNDVLGWGWGDFKPTAELLSSSLRPPHIYRTADVTRRERASLRSHKCSAESARWRLAVVVVADTEKVDAGVRAVGVRSRAHNRMRLPVAVCVSHVITISFVHVGPLARARSGTPRHRIMFA